MTLTKKIERVEVLPAAQLKGRNAAFDAIRLFATFSVIAVHVGTPVVENFSSSNSHHWWAGNFYEAVFRSGIPLFLMLTGALLMPRAKGFSFIQKRELRVFFPLAFWTFVYLIAKNPIKDIQASDFFHDLYYGNSYHFWYVYMIMSVYILMPFLRFIIDKLKPSITSVFLITCGATFILKMYSVEQLWINYSIDYIIYLAYIVFGYCLSNRSDAWWLNSMAFGLLLIGTGFIITFLGTYYLSDKAGVQNAYFYQSTTTHIFLKAVGVWIVFRNLTTHMSLQAAELLKSASKLSFGVFLIHPLVIDHILIVRLGLSHNFIHPSVGILVSTFMCFIVAMVILHLLSRLPFGKYTY